MQNRDSSKAASLQLYRNYTHTQIRPGKFAAYSQNTLLQENTSFGLLRHVKRILEDLNYKKSLFTVVKKNLLTLKMNR